jgi:multidrug efflux pump subunit AcrA (membrane-fusion protein)
VLQASGATLEIVASAAPADAALLTVGMPATFEGPDGAPLTATVAAVEATDSAAADGGEAGGPPDGNDADPAEAGRMTVTFTPQALDETQLNTLQGRNVRVSVPVAATGGEVLAVPLAALTAGPGGESRVEKRNGGTRSELLTVTTGLAADGYVEITGGDLEAGDLVVVGR